MGTKEKRLCEFGSRCYRKNPKHFEDFIHPGTTKGTGTLMDANLAGEVVKNKTRISPRIKMKQTTLTFPKKCEFSSAPKTKISDANMRKLFVKNYKEETTLVKHKNLNNKNNPAEFLPSKKKRKRSHSEKDKPKVRTQNKNKATSCFKGSDSNSELDDSQRYSSDCGTVESTSWVFAKSSKLDQQSDLDELKSKTNEEIIRTLFLVDMPADFYSFYEFCKSVNESHPSEALQICDIKLVGPFDVLSGKINYSVDKEKFLCHWRFYYDPPEFQTVLITGTGLHVGYWRDEPNENPVFLASNNSNKDCTFKIEAENIFGTVLHYLNGFLKSCDPFRKIKIKDVENDLSSWAEKNKFSLAMKTSKMTARQKKVVSKTFHGAGIVVPVEPKSGLGYRPLIETDANLKRICKLIMEASDEDERESLWENLQGLITAANIANDECDFGNRGRSFSRPSPCLEELSFFFYLNIMRQRMHNISSSRAISLSSLELGINLFCMGSPVFHETIEHLLCTAYSLLNRTEFEKITRAHLKFRRKGNNLSVFSEI